MGYYPEVSSNRKKARQIVYLYGGRILSKRLEWSDIPEGKALICVVDYGSYEAVVFIHSETELAFFTGPALFGSLPRTWRLIDRELACKLNGY